MSITIRPRDDKHYVSDLNVGTFFEHKGSAYMVTEFSHRALFTTAVCSMRSFGGTTLPSKTRVRVVKLVEAIFE